MRPRLIVVLPPGLDGVAGITETKEPMAIQTLITEPSLETLDEGVLDGFAWLDEAQPHSALIGPLIERLPCQLRAIVQDDLVGDTALRRQSLQHPHHPRSWQ